MPVILTNTGESNRSSVRILKEVSWGVTPASGVVKAARFTGSGLEATKETEISQEIRSDRMAPGIIEVAAGSSGETEVELSAGSLDDYIEAFVLSAWSKAMTFFQLKGTAVSILDNNTITLAGADYRNYLPAVNGYVKLDGFTNAPNNGYFQISAKNFSGGNTTIDVVGTPLTAEAGTAFTRIFDANDVILASNATAFTAGNTINGGGANSFAGQVLLVGQKIYVEGLGKETGTIQALATDPTEGDTISISDGVDSIVLEIRTNAALVAEGRVHVPFSGTPATLAENIRVAIMSQFVRQNIQVTAVAVTDTVTITNHRRTGGSLAASGSGVSLTLVAFSGGSATKGGFYTIASIPNDDTIVTVETLSTDANGGTRTVVVKGSHIRNRPASADIVKQSFTIETGFEDVSKYLLQKGMRVGTFNLEVEAGSILNGSVSFMGGETTKSSVKTLTGGGYTELDTTVTEVLNATSNVGQIIKDGVALTNVGIASISLEAENGLREQRVVGNKFPAGIGYGRITLSGSIMAFFSNFTYYQDFLDHTTTSLQFPVTDADFNTYYFTIPSMKITSNKISPEAIDEDVMEEMEFTAFRDVTLNTLIMIDRFSSVFPSAQA